MSTTGWRHTREHRSVLASVERRTLVWLALRLPAWIRSDHLSALGLVSMLGVGMGFAAFRVTPWAAAVVVVMLAANWFGDSLDGTVARVRGQERPRYGFYVDHVIDLLGTAFLFGGLASSGLMSPLIAAILLASYAIVCAETYLATHTAGVFRMSFLGFGPTELRLILAAGALKATDGASISLGGLVDLRLFDAGAVIAIFGLVVSFVVSAARNARALYKAEPLPMGHSESSSA